MPPAYSADVTPIHTGKPARLTSCREPPPLSAARSLYGNAIRVPLGPILGARSALGLECVFEFVHEIDHQPFTRSPFA
jgi:hypothetical protein